MLERYLMDQGRDFSRITNGMRSAYRQRYRSVRSVALSGFVVSSFVVPTLFAMEQGGVLTSSQALTLAEYVLLLATLEFLPSLVIMVILNIRFRPLSASLTRMESAWSYLVSAFRTEVLGLSVQRIPHPLDPGTEHQMLKDFYFFHYIFDTAMRSWLLQQDKGLLKGYLDKHLTELYKEQVKFMADKSLSYWSIMEKQEDRITKLLQGNADVKREIEKYTALVLGPKGGP